MHQQRIACRAGLGKCARRFGVGAECGIAIAFGAVDRGIGRCVDDDIGRDALDKSVQALLLVEIRDALRGSRA